MFKLSCNKIFALLFIAIIFYTSIVAFKNVAPQLYTTVKATELQNTSQLLPTFISIYDTSLSQENWTIQIFGLAQRLLGKREVKDFSIIKDDENNLYLGDLSNYSFDIITAGSNIQTLYEHCDSNDIDFLYVRAPYKSSENISSLTHYGVDDIETNEEMLLDLLHTNNIPQLDLKKFKKAINTYRTDHHWTVESSFFASCEIAKELSSLYSLALDKTQMISNPSNYTRMSYPDSFLGSIGVKVGSLYAGKDDFSILKPNFSTDLTYQYKINGDIALEKSGDFWNTLVDDKILDTPEYNNKYNACLNAGSNESIIMNLNAENDLKLLLITHSYGRPMTQYLSLFFCETRYLDPQIGRFEGSFLKYIDEYQPDIVVVMYNDKFNVSFE